MTTSTKVTAKTTAPVVVSAWGRIIRSLIQDVIGLGAAIPTLIVALNLNAMQATKVSSVTAGAVFLATVVQNVLEHFGIWATITGQPVTPTPAALQVTPPA